MDPLPYVFKESFNITIVKDSWDDLDLLANLFEFAESDYVILDITRIFDESDKVVIVRVIEVNGVL